MDMDACTFKAIEPCGHSCFVLTVAAISHNELTFWRFQKHLLGLQLQQALQKCLPPLLRCATRSAFILSIVALQYRGA